MASGRSLDGALRAAKFGRPFEDGRYLQGPLPSTSATGPLTESPSAVDSVPMNRLRLVEIVAVFPSMVQVAPGLATLVKMKAVCAEGTVDPPVVFTAAERL